MTPIFPPRWKEQDNISIVAPSFVFDLGRIAEGTEAFQYLGFVPKFPSGIEAREGYFAGPDHHRAMILSRAFDDPETTGVLCARGGYGASRLLPHLPYDHLREHPKLIVGFSDITALAMALYAKTGLCSIHGPMLGTLRWDEDSTMRLVRLVSGEPMGKLQIPAPLPMASGIASGPLLGGNLCLITSLLGTPYLPSFKGAILYLEEVDERPYRLDRMLTQLELAGVLDEISGVLLGDFSGCDDPTYPVPGWLEVTEARLSKRGIPVLAGFPGGHRRMNWPVIIGARVTLNANEGYIESDDRLAPR
jgi:muramoyltetrapeptide carboxypeptidase